MVASRSLCRLALLGQLLVGASLALGGCAGRSTSHGDDDGGTGNTSGTSATGGTVSGSGGTHDAGGTTSVGDAPGIGGTSVGGTTNSGFGGTGGTVTTGCDTGCPDVDCTRGQHLETLPGACCPSCLPGPSRECATGQESYTLLRNQLLDKYGSLGCKTDADCALVTEDNACMAICNIALPSSTVMNYVANLNSYASGCASCDSPTRSPCQKASAACMNGECVPSYL